MIEKYYNYRLKQLKKKRDKYKKEIKLYESRKEMLSSHDYKFITDFLYSEVELLQIKINKINKKMKGMK